MAAITPVTLSGKMGRAQVFRTGVAQANIGQTDWIYVPTPALQASLLFNFTSAAGTTPLWTELRLFAHTAPGTLDDAHKQFLGTDGATNIVSTSIDPTSGARAVVDVGLMNIANDITMAGANAYGVINCVLPYLLGVQMVFDRTTGNETYTYTASILFRGGRAF